MKSLTSSTVLVDASLSMRWSMEQKMASLLLHWVGLWIVSGKLVIEFNCFQLTCFIFWLAFLVIMIHPSCYRDTGTWYDFHILHLFTTCWSARSISLIVFNKLDIVVVITVSSAVFVDYLSTHCCSFRGRVIKLKLLHIPFHFILFFKSKSPLDLSYQ